MVVVLDKDPLVLVAMSFHSNDIYIRSAFTVASLQPMPLSNRFSQPFSNNFSRFYFNIIDKYIEELQCNSEIITANLV